MFPIDLLRRCMLYLTLNKGITRKDGTRAVVPVAVTKQHRYAEREASKNISVKASYLLQGGAQSGKSKWIMRLYASSHAIWRGKPVVCLSARQPLAQWLEHNNEAIAYVERQKDVVSWASLPQWKRYFAWYAWFVAVRPVLLLDDAHLLSGRKLDLVAKIVPHATVIIASATAETRIPVSVRMALQQRRLEILQLKSNQPVDMTTAIMWFVTIISLASGAWQVAAALGGLQLLAKGALSSRQT